MEHRATVQIDFAFFLMNRAQYVVGVAHHITVAEHDAFRVAGGAAGIEEPGEVVLIHLLGVKSADAWARQDA